MTSTTYEVTGMTCDHCAAAVTTEVSKLTGVTEVAVDVPTGRVSVTSDQPLDEQAVAEAIDEAGYALISA